MEKCWAWEAKKRLEIFVSTLQKQRDTVKKKTECLVKKTQEWMKGKEMPVCIYL